MQTALGVLNWTPQTFWASTHWEFCEAVNGRLAMNKRRTEGQVKPLTVKEYQALKEELDADVPTHSIKRTAPGTRRPSAKRRKKKATRNGNNR